MSIASNATDQQVGEILQAIQDVTPEVIKQAMAYSHFVNEVWLGIFGVVEIVLAIVFCRCLSIVKRNGWFDKEGPVLTIVLSGYIIVICLIGSAACVNDLVKLSIAPDYYAAECVAKLLGR